MALLQRQGRVSYRALKRQFDLDEAYVEEVKLELIEATGSAVGQDTHLTAPVEVCSWSESRRCGGAYRPPPPAG